MKNSLVLFVLIFPTFCTAQIKKISVGMVFVENQPRLTLNFSAKKSNHHLIYKHNTLQISNAWEFSKLEAYIFASKNLSTRGGYLGLGIQKGFRIANSGSVIMYVEKELVTGNSYTFGAAMHPQIILYRRKTPRE